MEKKYILVLDAGTGGGRCNIFDSGGNLVAGEYREWFYDRYQQDGLEFREFDPDSFWNIIKKLIRATLDKAGIEAEKIAAVTSTSQREGIVLLDENDREVYAGPNLDFRGEKEARWLAENFGREIYRVSGHWPHAIFAPARLLWFKNNESKLYKRFKTLLMINDWLLFRLTGEKYCEPTNASETLLFNLKNGEWDRDLIERIGLNPALFPSVKDCGQEIGKITRKAALSTGLAAGTPVFTGGADTQAAVLGTGGINPGHVTVVAGTSAPVQAIISEPIIDSRSRVWTGCYLQPHKWVLDSNARPTGVVYRWLRNTIYRDKRSYDLMNEEAAAVPPGCNGVMACLGPSISNVKDQGQFPGTIIGLEPDYEEEACRRGLFSRAVLENIAYAIRGNVEQIGELTNEDIVELHLTGGNSRSRLLVEIMASVLDLPLKVAASSESTSLGAAILAAVGAGIYQDLSSAAEVMVDKPETVLPEPELVEIYGQLYDKWLSLYQFLITNNNKLKF